MPKFGPGNPYSFKAGQSGNPGGRTKALARVEDLAKQYTADAIATLAEICKDAVAPAAARVSAANVLLDRGWGKPRQELAVTLDATDLSDEALLAIVAKGQVEMEAEQAALLEEADGAARH